ncbi:peptidase P60 [Photobacterium kishitanii]|nr:peptidase P60 [Photobacterium kishitanii]KJG57965.1 peptidase P60 [Photobacterium kishitanii]KJG61540.1 peptidase P60 [Photobacterium kishitanii]KJG66351.1 peptidase P60 [Photobacterium kishitanii]KJG69690.1 peptidase P60 [Photobacterium kishitanii]
MTKKAILILFVLLASVGCSSTPAVNETATTKSLTPPPKLQIKPALPLDNGVFDGVYHSWKGTPYRYGGSSKKGIDCSAFVQVGYSSVYQKLLPRTTLELVKKGKQVKRNTAKEGDLVFFRTGRNTRHVGIYLGNSEFLHASQSKGVMISRLDNPYWKRHFWQIRRLNKY